MIRAWLSAADWMRSAREPDDYDASLEGDALGRPVVGVAADRVVDHVGAAALGGVLHDLDEVLGVPVHHDVGAQLTREPGLVRAADHAR